MRKRLDLLIREKPRTCNQYPVFSTLHKSIALVLRDGSRYMVLIACFGSLSAVFRLICNHSLAFAYYDTPLRTRYVGEGFETHTKADPKCFCSASKMEGLYLHEPNQSQHPRRHGPQSHTTT